MTKSKIEQKLHAMIRKGLLADGPWPPDNEAIRALSQQLADWDLEHVGGDGNIRTTALGRELRISLLGLFLGYHELFEIPHCLQHEGVLAPEEADELEAQCLDKRGWARDVDDLAPILKPVLARLYREEFPEFIPA